MRTLRVSSALRRAVLLTAAALLGACHRTPELSPDVRSAYPPGWEFQPGIPATFAPHAMVVSMSRPASEAGVEIMREGGNAVDAAVATGFALAVTYPAAGNIGGGGFMTIRMADGRTATLDYREVAPLAATHDMYVENGKLTNRSTVGYLASGVPGSVAGMAEALRKYGTMSLAQVMAPAIRLAERGFVVDSGAPAGERPCPQIIARFEGKDLFCPGGVSLEPGARLVQPDLARTLRLIAAEGPKAFYEGSIADSLVPMSVAAAGSSRRRISAATRRCGARRSSRRTAATR